jgi:cation transport regulator ChaC
MIWIANIGSLAWASDSVALEHRRASAESFHSELVFLLTTHVTVWESDGTIYGNAGCQTP